MSRDKDNKLCDVFVQDGVYFLRTPSGEIVPLIFSINVTDDNDTPHAVATIKLFVNLV